MPYEVRYEQAGDLVIIRLAGEPGIDEFLQFLQQLGADSVGWTATAALVDLRGVKSPYSFTEQLRIGEAVGRNLKHLRRVAAVVPPERITRVGEKAARHTGATVNVFAVEQEAVDWLRAG